jgi:hypothetical protein
MKIYALALAASFVATAALAQTTTTVIQKEGPVGDRTIVHERSDSDVVATKKVTTTSSVGCSSKTVKKTNEFGDTKTVSKTDC